ncbi:MAG TPA: hypothetical protein VM537_08875 [Anaerolineae bacterium]|nr:hypothetical protein [Anaerolineae bacterium]
MERRTVWIIVVVVALLLCCCALTVGGAAVGIGLIPWSWQRNWDFDIKDINIPGVESRATMEESFVVEGTPLLDVECPVCDVQIRGRSGDTVEIEATKRSWSGSKDAAARQLDGINVTFTQQGDTVFVKVDIPQLGGAQIGRRASVDLKISVPEETDLKLNLDVAQVEVDGIEGQVDIQADVGEVVLDDVVARDSLKVRTDVARIRFNGPLSEGVRYDMRSEVGDIALTLPAGSRFEVDAESNVGAATCEFAVSGVEGRKGLVGGRVVGTVGENPTAALELRSEVGSIRIYED